MGWELAGIIGLFDSTICYNPTLYMWSVTPGDLQTPSTILQNHPPNLALFWH